MKTFLSIGAGPGIGHETALQFAEKGFHIVLAARNLAKTQHLAEDLRRRGFSAEALRVDANEREALAALIGEVDRRHDGIDALHYNAAVLRNATIETQESETLISDLVTNIGGALIAIQAASGPMIARRSGTILLTGGGFGLQPSPDYLSLSIGKAGIRALTLGLFDDFKAKGVHVATVTVGGFVHPATNATREIGEAFWSLHDQAPDTWTPEITYTPGA